MKTRTLPVFLICVAIGLCLPACAARTVTGTVISWAQDTLLMQPDEGTKAVPIKPASDASIERGQVGKEPRKAVLWDFAPGDQLVATVKADGRASSIKGSYEVAKGAVVAVKNNKIFLSDGSAVKLRPNLQVVFSEGKMGKPSELQAGTLILCRLNPSSKEAWTVVATSPAVLPKPAAAPVKASAAPKAAPKPQAAKPPAVKPAVANTPPTKPNAVVQMPVPAEQAKPVTPPPAKPEIKAITFKGPSPLKVRDWVRVDLEGTPGVRATCQVKGLIPVTVMDEPTPGHYRASVMIPSGKPVTDAALIGKLSVEGIESDAVQASRLITIAIEPNSAPPAPPSIVIPAAQAVPAPVQKPKTPAPQSAPPPHVNADPPAAPASADVPETSVQPTAVATAPAVEPAPEKSPDPVPQPPQARPAVVLTSPSDDARITKEILLSGTAEPGSQVMVSVTYDNQQTGLLKISGSVCSQLVAVSSDGRFSFGPVALEGPLATQGLIFTISAGYQGSDQVARVKVVGDRS